MAGRYYVETFVPGETDQGFREEFEGFTPAYEAATAKVRLQPDRKVRIHLPASATDEERQKVDEAGWEKI